jgi:hypothetical protein
LGPVELTNLAEGYRLQGMSEDEVRAAVLNAQDTARARQYIMEDLGTVRQGADRGALAAEAFRLIQEAGEPSFQRSLRETGQRAAQYGRIGAGMTTNELTDIYSQRERDLDQLRSGLALEAAQQELADRMGILGASQAVGGQLFGQDVTQAQLGLARANALQGLAGQNVQFGQIGTTERFAERAFQAEQKLNQANLALQRARAYGDQSQIEASYAQAERAAAEREEAMRLQQANLRSQMEWQVEQADVVAMQNQFNQLQSLAAQLSAQGREKEAALARERAYQYQLSIDALNFSIQQRRVEEDLYQHEWERQMDLLNLLYDLGFSDADAAAAIAQMGDYYSSEGNQDFDLAAWLAEILGQQPSGEGA